MNMSKKLYVIIAGDPVDGIVYEGMSAAKEALTNLLNQEWPNEREQYSHCRYGIGLATPSELAETKERAVAF